MSDLGVIIPIAVVLVVALALGGSSGVSEPNEEDFFDEYYDGRVLEESFAMQQSFAMRQDTQTVRSDITSATEQRFDRDREDWEQNPREGGTILRAAKDVFFEVSQSLGRIQELAQTLDQEEHHDIDTDAMVEDLQRRIVDHEEKYVDFKEKNILRYYVQALEHAENEITESIRESDNNFVFGGSEPMSVEQRQFMIQKFTNILHEIKSFGDTQSNILYEARRSLTYQTHTDEKDQNEFLDGGAPASEMGGYPISETNSANLRAIGVSHHPSAFTQVQMGSFGREPSSALITTPDVPEPQTGAVAGSFFAQPKSLETQLHQSQLASIREEASHVARPLTPVKPIQTVNRGSPSFQKSESEVRKIINRDYVAQELRAPMESFSEYDVAVFKDELAKIEGQLNVAVRNKDSRGLAKVQHKINNSAPPGTPKRSYYDIKNNVTEPTRLDFDVKETPTYKAWLKVLNKVMSTKL